MELAIQQYIRKYGLEAAKSTWHLQVNESGNLIQLNYHMIDSPRGEPACEECRGLILDKQTWEVIAYPFRRFYNDHEKPYAASIDINKATLQEKVDGTLIIHYFNPFTNSYEISTRGSIGAQGPVGTYPITFADLFKEVLSKYPRFNPKDFVGTLCFELVGKRNRILTPYEEDAIYLIGARDKNLNEVCPEILDDLAKYWGVHRPKLYNFNSFADINTLLDDINSADEGFVLVDYTKLVDGSFRRVKIKNPRYKALKHLVGAGEEDCLSNKRLMTIILQNRIDEVIELFPEYTNALKDGQQRVQHLIDQIKNDYEQCVPHKNNRKEFAMRATKTVCPAALFMMLDDKIDDISQYIYDLSADRVIKMLEIMEK